MARAETPELRASFQAVWQALRELQRPLLLTHANPDADAVASILAVDQVLRREGARPTPAVGDGRLPASLAFLPGADRLVDPAAIDFDTHDGIVLLDCADAPRLGPLHRDNPSRFNGRIPLINIDHHVTNQRYGIVNLIHPEASATCEILTRLFLALRIEISPDVATCLMAGIYGDTLALRTPSTTPDTLRLTADLLERRADHKTIVDRMFRAKPFSTVKLWAEALSRATLTGAVVWTEITPEMLERSGALAAEGEGIVNFLAGSEGALIGALFYEQPDGWRVSLRSIHDEVDVAEIAGAYGGGGHSRAAGCALPPGRAPRDAFLRDVAARLASLDCSTP